MATERAMLEYSSISELSEQPERWMVFLHGILGRRANWRSIAKQFVAARPQWGAILVDLRMHGDSQDFAPPHTLASAASDIEALLPRLNAPVEGMLGHSFGGKVALAYLAQAEVKPRQIWVIDSQPGQREPGTSGADKVLRTLRQLPTSYASREAFIEATVSQGIMRPTASWLAMNLERVDAEFRLNLNLDAIAELMRDYALRDLWPMVESPPEGSRVDFVYGGQSDTLAADDRERLRRASKSSRLHVHEIADAGHWVHSEKPHELLALLISETA